MAISLVALAGCGGESPRPPEEAPAETLDVEKEATEEVGRLGIREAMGQMFVVGMSGTEPDYYIEKMVRELNIGGVLLFGYNMESEEGLRAGGHRLCREALPKSRALSRRLSHQPASHRPRRTNLGAKGPAPG